MPEVKTRDVVKGTVKTIDKAAVAGERMRAAYIRTRDQMNFDSAEGSTETYAAERLSSTVETVAHDAAHLLGKQVVGTAKDNLHRGKQALRQHLLKKQKIAAGSVRNTAHLSSATDMVRRTEIGRSLAGIKTPDRSKKTVKTAQRFIKTPEQTAQMSIKAAHAAEKTVKVAQNTVQEAAKVSWQVARRSADVAKSSVKAVAKTTITAIKNMIAVTRSLITATMAGGWIVVVVVLLVCVVALVVGSCFGIFFSGEDSGTGQTMPDVVREINADYQRQLGTIQANIHYDVLELSGSRAVWPEVLSVYSVKTTTDPDRAQEVATMDDSKKAILKDIFWKMNEISSRTQTKTEAVATETDDGNGNIVQTTTTVTRIYLYITVNHKTVEEMADEFNFTAGQREQLAELLADENHSLWNAVLYGIGGGDGDIVTVALSQLGNVGGGPYWSWYGFNSRVEWCACFVSWCANECGYIEAGVIPQFANCSVGVEWFQAHGLWQDNRYEPCPGDIIFFDWDGESGQNGVPDHVGIVEKVENGIVYTIEGNSGDACRENHYTVGDYEIYGYGAPAY